MDIKNLLTKIDEMAVDSPSPSQDTAPRSTRGNTREFKGKLVDIGSLEIADVDMRDHPDFTDAYFIDGEYTDGTPMSDQDLEEFTAENHDLIYDKAMDAGVRIEENQKKSLKDYIAEAQENVDETVRLGFGDKDGKFKRPETMVQRHQLAKAAKDMRKAARSSNVAAQKKFGQYDDPESVGAPEELPTSGIKSVTSNPASTKRNIRVAKTGPKDRDDPLYVPGVVGASAGKNMLEMVQQSPIPVVGKQGEKTSSQVGFVHIDDTSPAGRAMSDALGKLAKEKKAQIVVPTTQQAGTIAGAIQKPGTAQQAGATSSSTLREEGAGEEAVMSFQTRDDDDSMEHHRMADVYKDGDDYVVIFSTMAPGMKAPNPLRTKDAGQAEQAARKYTGNTQMNEAKKPKEPFAIGMAAAKKAAGITKKHAKDLPKNVIKKGHEIGKKIEKEKVDEKWAGDAKVEPTGEYADKSKAELKSMLAKLHKSGPHKKGSPEAKKQQQINFALRAKGGWKKGEGAAMKEAEIPSSGPDFGAGLGAGRSQETLESKHKQHGKEKMKKKVKESMNSRLKAAYQEGYAHGLREQSCRVKHYDDMEEARKYYEGYKCGLDECYGMGVNEGVLGTLGGAALGGLVGGPIGAAVGAVGGQEMTKGGSSLFDEDEKHSSNTRQFKGKLVNVDSLEIADVDMRDHPDFTDAYFINGEYTDGTPMSDEDLQEFTDENHDLIYDKAMDSGLRETSMPAATVPGMADQAMDEAVLMDAELDEMMADLDEMNRTEYMKHKAKTTPGDTFKAFGQEFKDEEVLEDDAFMFESLENQLNALLESEEPVTEGLSVSMSTGQPGMQGDSVSVTATDDDAGKLLDFVKKVALGGMGPEEAHPEAHAVVAKSDYGAPSHTPDDHDSMLAVIKKMTGGDYEQEADHEHSSSCGCEDSDVHEDQSEDQMEYEVAEDAAEDAEVEMTDHDEDAEAQEDKALALDNMNEGGDGMEELSELKKSTLGNYAKKAFLDYSNRLDRHHERTDRSSQNVDKIFNRDRGLNRAINKLATDKEDMTEEELTEWANEAGKKGTDETFETDIDFMTQFISGGLNKPKSTGQTTIPVIAGQKSRMGADALEGAKDPIAEWQKLSGIK